MLRGDAYDAQEVHGAMRQRESSQRELSIERDLEEGYGIEKGDN